jgi:hypothetical protein
MTTPPDYSPSKLLARLSRAMQIVLLLTIFLLSIALYWISTSIKKPDESAFLTAIATGLLVSAAFGLAQTFITGRVTSELLRASVVSEVRTSLYSSAQEFYPTIDIPASATPNLDFNRILMQDLKDSTVYWFRGISARFTAVRLSINTNPNLQANLILPDVCQPYALDGRITYAYRHNLHPGETLDQIRERTMQEVVLGIVGALEARPRCFGIQLLLTPDPALDRYEIFRDSAWVTLYSGKGTGTMFPRTLRFSNESITYRAQEVECLHTREHPATRIIDIPRNLSLTEKVALVEQILGVRFSEELYIEANRKFDNFAKQFRDEIKLS